MKANWVGIDIESAGELNRSDIGIGAANYHFGLLICCPICGYLDVINVSDPNRMKWDWDQGTLTLSPSVKVTVGAAICHYNLTNGEFVIHGDSTEDPHRG